MASWLVSDIVRPAGVLQSEKTRAVEIHCYTQTEIKTQTKSNATNQTDLLITYSNGGTRKQ